MAKDDAACEAQWLSDLSLRGSQHRKTDGMEATIMRLSSHPELLHCFLNASPDPVGLSPVGPTNFNVLLESKYGGTAGVQGNAQLSRTLIYNHPSSSDDRATSLEPLAFRPTNEDARLAIAAEILTMASGDSNATPRKPRRAPICLLVALALAVMLTGLFALA